MWSKVGLPNGRRRLVPVTCACVVLFTCIMYYHSMVGGGNKATPARGAIHAIQEAGRMYGNLGHDVHQILLEPEDRCKDAGDYDAIMVVHSAPTNYEKRKIFRHVYNDFNNTNPYRLKVVFLVGVAPDLALGQLLLAESAIFHDMVQGNFLDDYRNMTYKAILGFHWLDKRCHGMKLLLRVDDDTFVNVPGFLKYWSTHYAGSDDIILCESKPKAPVQREGQWAVSEEEYSGKEFDFPHCFGWFAAISPNLIPKMHEMSRKMPFFWIDDIFMYGMVPKAIGSVKFADGKHIFIKDGENEYRLCLVANGRGCHWLASIARPILFDRLLAWKDRCPCPSLLEH